MISERDRYLDFCQEMRSFLLSRVRLHLRFITALYTVGLAISLFSLWLMLGDGDLTWSETGAVGILAAQLYLLVRFHIIRYSTSVIERTRWHKYYESALRLEMLAEFQHKEAEAADALLSHTTTGLFPDYDEARRLAFLRSLEEEGATSIREWLGEKVAGNGK